LPLDYDRELQTVGWSNFVSGCCGGYTGSYIFSQTIFTLRRGVTDDSRVCGWYAFVLRSCGCFFCTLQLTRCGILV
jgi:MFS superfamily sulfate permease-like transporter